MEQILWTVGLLAALWITMRLVLRPIERLVEGRLERQRLDHEEAKLEKEAAATQAATRVAEAAEELAKGFREKLAELDAAHKQLYSDWQEGGKAIVEKAMRAMHEQQTFYNRMLERFETSLAARLVKSSAEEGANRE